jgi:hypothetical protein
MLSRKPQYFLDSRQALGKNVFSENRIRPGIVMAQWYRFIVLGNEPAASAAICAFCNRLRSHEPAVWSNYIPNGALT